LECGGHFTSVPAEIGGLDLIEELSNGSCPPPLWIRQGLELPTRYCDQGKAPSARRVPAPLPLFPAKATGILRRWHSIRSRRFAGALQNVNTPEKIGTANSPLTYCK